MRMTRNTVYVLAGLLLAYGIFILQVYGLSYKESAMPVDFAGFVVLTVLSKFVFILMLTASAYGYGGMLFRRWLPAFGSLLEEGLVKAGLGLIVISYLMFALGYARLLYAPAGYAVLVAGVLLGARDITGYVVRVYGIPRTFNLGLVNVLLLGLSALFLIRGVMYTMLPPIAFDGLMYHLGVPMQYIEAHRIIPTPDINGSMFPFGIEMIYMLGMMVESVISAKLVSYFMAVASGLAAVAFTRRFVKSGSGLATFTVYISIPMVAWLMQQSYVGLSQAFYVMMSLYALAAAAEREEEEHRWLVMAALFCGFNLAIKYTGVLVVGVLTLRVFIGMLAMQKRGLKRALAGTAVFIGISALICSPWYIRNIIEYHNPVYPFLAGLFGNVDTGGAMPVAGSFLPKGPWDAVNRIVTSFWMTTLKASGYEMNWNNGLGPCLLMLIPGAFIFGRPGRDLARLMVFCLAFFALMMLRGNLRYLTPILPALAVIASYPIDRLAGGEDRVGKTLGKALVVLTVFAVLMSALTKRTMVSYPPYSQQATDRYYKDYYTKNRNAGFLTTYDVWRWINTTLPEDAVIYQLWDDASVYFRKRKTIGSALTMTDTGRQRIHYIKGRVGFGGFLPGEQIIANLKEMGAGYLLINANREGRTVPNDPYFNAHALPMLDEKGVYLYKIE